MRGVKGLVIKEIYLRRKTFFWALAVLLLFYILAASFALSFDFGNLKDRTDLSRDMVIPLAYAIAAAAMTVFCLGSETAAKDTKCGWNTFQSTLPLSPRTLAAVRTGFSLAAWLAGFILSLAMSAGLIWLAHREFTGEMFANITLIGAAVYVTATAFDIILLAAKDPSRAGQTAAAVLIFAIFAAAAFAYTRAEGLAEALNAEPAAALRYIEENFLSPLTDLRDRLFALSPLILAAAAAAGYFVTLRLYKRREK